MTTTEHVPTTTPSGRVACTECLAIAPTLELLEARPCLGAFHD